MQLYLDSANLEHITRAASLGILSGITTNPSLLAKEDPNVDIKKRILEIYNLVGGHLSVEVISTDTNGMLREADEILKWFPDATIKVPIIPAGLAAVRKLSERGIPTNVTLVFSANQAIAAQNAGATYVSVFMGRLDDISLDSNRVLEDICQIWDVQNYDSEIIAASIRTPIHLTQAAMAGAHIATVPYNVLMQSLQHPLTDSGLKKFLDDYSKLQSDINRIKQAKNENFSNQKPNLIKVSDTNQNRPKDENRHSEQRKPEPPKQEPKKEEISKPEAPKQELKQAEPVKQNQPKEEIKQVEPVKQNQPKEDTKKEEKVTEVELKVEEKILEAPKQETKKEEAPKVNLTKPAPKTNRRGGRKKAETTDKK